MKAAGALLVLALLVVARPAPATPEYLVGVYYFAGWWRQQTNKWVVDGKDWREHFPARVPLLGEYNEQETMDREIAAAVQEDVDAVGLSVMSGAHMTLFPAVVSLLRQQGAAEVVVFGGGIIPQDDVPRLKELGVAEVFLPGTPTQAAIEWIRTHVKPRAEAA